MNHRGFSIVEFLITLATLSVGAYKGLEFLENQRSEILLVHQDIEMQAITQDIRRLLMNTQNCSASFLGNSADTPEGQITYLTTVTTVENKQYSTNAYPTSVDPTQSYGPSRLRIHSYQLRKEIESKIPSSQLIVKFDQSYAKKELRQKMKEESFKIFLELDQNNKIVKCSMKEIENEQRFWRDEGESLAYSDGFVGIYNPTPQLTLDIQGRVQFQPNKVNIDCHSSIKGMLTVLSIDKKLQICDGVKWIKF